MSNLFVTTVFLQITSTVEGKIYTEKKEHGRESSGLGYLENPYKKSPCPLWTNVLDPAEFWVAY